MNVLQIGYDVDSYVVYERPGIYLYRGTYTQCLIVVGGVSMNRSLEDSIILANSVDIFEPFER